jgi:thiosulfate/3-mercaptopyruvate sulfurtransferase
MKDYATPDVLVSTEWVDQHKNDPNIRIVEVDVDTNAYNEGHVPGALGWNWQTQLCDTLQRDVISKTALEKLLGSSGIGNNSTIILYGDNNNWFAAWALWQLKMYGHADVRIMNGGRKKWLAEGRNLSQDIPGVAPQNYSAAQPDHSIRTYLSEAMQAMNASGYVMVDVRSNDEYTGKILAPPGLPETCQRGGHIPGAKNIPWAQACNEDGTFKSREELQALYESKGVTGDKKVIAYCRIGERSSHTWFVLKYLLGYPQVSNYDGSWTEWGNLVGAPVEKPSASAA